IITRYLPARFHRQFLWQVFLLASFVHRQKFAREHPDLMRYVAITQRQRPAAAGVQERRTLHWFYQLTGRYAFFQAYLQPGEALILDDGFVHRTVHLHASSVETPDPAAVRGYVDLIPRPDIVIMPCAPIDVCEERVLRRGIWKHYRNRPRADLRRYLESSNLALSSAIERIKAKDWKVIEVDNGHDDLTRTHEELRNKLMTILSTDHRTDTDMLASWKPQAPWVPPLPRPSRLSEFVKSRIRSLDIELETVQTVVDRFGLKL